MVIADTSVWIPFFNDPASPEKRELDALIDADDLALVGVVLAELIQGCRVSGSPVLHLGDSTCLRVAPAAPAGCGETGRRAPSASGSRSRERSRALELADSRHRVPRTVPTTSPPEGRISGTPALAS